MAPKYDGPQWDFYQFLENDFWFWLVQQIPDYEIPVFEYKSAKGLVLKTAGANHPLAMASIPADAYAWSQDRGKALQEWFTYYKDDEMLALLEESKSRFDPMCRVKGTCESCLCKPRLGRLHPIEEAAGKVRVVAICDYFTQVALKPVHDWLFDLLREIPTDATFGQQENFDFFLLQGHKEVFSFDLKAATDLIPIELYYLLMRDVLDFKAAAIWQRLLVSRDFFANPTAFGLPARDELAPDGFLVRYTRGQPMGALSSWASLALLHHALVQFAAKRVGRTRWFLEYLVLGDDIVIGNEEVAQSYLEVCNEYGITVGLAKSLISREGLMNFASQTAIRNENISPLSLKEELSAQDISSRVALAERVLHRWGGDRTGHGFLKRVLSEPEWSAVSDGGIRGSGSRNLNLIRFLVETPFIRKDEESVTTGNVISWLGFVDPELRKLPNGVRQDFDKALMVYTLGDLVRLLRTRLNNMASLKNHIRSFLYERDRVIDTIELPPISPNDVKPLVPKDPTSIDELYLTRGGIPGLRLNKLFGLESPRYIEYLLESLERSLDTVVWSKLKELRKELKGLVHFYVDEDDLQVPELCPSYDELVSKYNRLMAIPNPTIEVGLNRERTLYALFKKLPEELGERLPPWKEKRETIKGPVGAVSKALVRVLGVLLPIDTILHRDSSNIFSMLRRLQADTLKRWAVRDASPCKAEQSMAVVPWSAKGWFYHDPGVWAFVPGYGEIPHVVDTPQSQKFDCGDPGPSRARSRPEHFPGGAAKSHSGNDFLLYPQFDSEGNLRKGPKYSRVAVKEEDLPGFTPRESPVDAVYIDERDKDEVCKCGVQPAHCPNITPPGHVECWNPG
jgi:hypothetical protein